MAARTVVDMFMAGGHYVTDSSLTASDDYIPLADIKDTYIGIGLAMFNNATTGSAEILWTGSNASSSGDILDDKIITEAALWMADVDYDNIKVDPDTGREINRHKKAYNDLMAQVYGIRLKSGRVVTPRESKVSKPSKIVKVVENQDN